MTKPKKVAMIYHILAHYREPIFQMLCRQQNEIEYTLFSDPVNTYDSVKPIDPKKAELPADQGGLRWRFVKNKWFFKNLLWQKGAIKLGLSREFDAIVYLGSVYFISTWISAILARLTGKRVLMWTHGFLRDERGFKGWIRTMFYRLADGLLLYHNRAKDIFIKKGFNPDNLYVVYNSLDYDTQLKLRASITEEDKSACRKRLFEHPELPILLFIGRLTPQKKLTMLFDAVKIRSDSGCPCNLLFVGGGPESEPLKQKAVEIGLVENLCLYGPCYDEKENALLISCSDICIAPGEVGLTAMHSLVYGTPVLTHDDPDFQMPEYEAIKPGYNGAFFKKDDAADMASVIQCWLTENPDRQVISKKCYEIIDQFYNPNYQLKIINNAVKG